MLCPPKQAWDLVSEGQQQPTQRLPEPQSEACLSGPDTLPVSTLSPHLLHWAPPSVRGDYLSGNQVGIFQNENDIILTKRDKQQRQVFPGGEEGSTESKNLNPFQKEAWVVGGPQQAMAGESGVASC